MTPKKTYVGSMANACEPCRRLAKKSPEFFAPPDVPDGQTYFISHCVDCGTHHWRYPTQGDLGIRRHTGCGSKKSYATREAAERARLVLNQTHYRCWCGRAAPVSALGLEAYECSILKKDWHIAPKVGRPRPPSIWDDETLGIVRSRWEAEPPWEIAQQVNQVLWARGGDGKTHDHCVTHTSFAGGGVIYQAWEMGLIATREARDQLIKTAQKQSRAFLQRSCEHGRKFKECVLCYLGESEGDS
jgi:hypothetical protein